MKIRSQNGHRKHIVEIMRRTLVLKQSSPRVHRLRWVPDCRKKWNNEPISYETPLYRFYTIRFWFEKHVGTCKRSTATGTGNIGNPTSNLWKFTWSKLRRSVPSTNTYFPSDSDAVSIVSHDRKSIFTQVCLASIFFNFFFARV